MNTPLRTCKLSAPLLLCLTLSSPVLAEDSVDKTDTENAHPKNSETLSVTDTVKHEEDNPPEKTDSTQSPESSDPQIDDFISVSPNLTDLTDLDEEAAEWADDKREDVKDQLGDWAQNMNGWFGKPDPRKPATANLRIVLDTRWEDDPVEGSNWRVKPRIRGKLRLPVLEEKLSLIIGDEDLDEEVLLRQDTSKTTFNNNSHKTYDGKQARDDNAAIALRWSEIKDTLGVDADVGVRSGDDVYVKFSIDKDWYKDDQLTVSNHNFYRYGSDSEHTLKGEVNFEYGLNATKFINNNTTLRYRNEDNDDETTWSNELRQVHYLGNKKQLSYGLSTFGYLDDDKPTLNSYGPAISYRQPFWRKWLYVQTELNYFNNKEDDKDHFVSALLRLEALF